MVKRSMIAIQMRKKAGLPPGTPLRALSWGERLWRPFYLLLSGYIRGVFSLMSYWMTGSAESVCD